MTPLAITVLSWMLALQPRAVTPWASTYEDTAQAIADVVQAEEPLFAEDDDRVRTAALLVAVGWTEGRFNAHAIGDHGSAMGEWQIHASSYAPEAARPGYLDDVELQARVALRMLRTSLTACRWRPVDDRLAWYTSGTCTRGGGASRFRMAIARRLARAPPTP